MPPTSAAAIPVPPAARANGATATDSGVIPPMNPANIVRPCDAAIPRNGRWVRAVPAIPVVPKNTDLHSDLFGDPVVRRFTFWAIRSEEHTSELQSLRHL